MTRVLITGGAGFVGSALTERLLERGDEVVVIDNFATARQDSLPEGYKGLTVQEGSIADGDLVERLYDEHRPEVVVHAAASYKDPTAWAEDARTNVVGTANVVRAAERGGVSRLIYFQTALCYGLHPLEQPITVDHPLRPEASSYAVSKTAGEYYVRLSSLNWISFRLANVYGARHLSGPLPAFYQRLAEGRPVFVVDTRRDFVYLEDLLDVVVKAVDGQGKSGVYHVSTGSDVAIKDLYEATARAMGLDPGDVEVRPRGPDDAPSILLDASKTEQEFDWRAKTPLDEGIAASIEWYKQYGVTESFTHLRLAEKT
jgi:UDP-glucose 4-epimerase